MRTYPRPPLVRFRSRRPCPGAGLFAAAAAITAAAALPSGCGSSSRTVTIPRVARFQQTNLVADTASAGAAHVDTNLVNPWGLAFSPTGPFWLANNHTGTSTIYNSSGTPQALVVSIPAPGSGGGAGAPTGTVFNGTADFVVPANGRTASFLFATEDGTIAAWNGSAGSKAVLVADRSGAGAVYKGLAVGSTAAGNVLFATDFHNGVVDRFDKNFQYLGSFKDASAPAGFAPFGIQNIGGQIYVAYAKQLPPDNHDDEAGPGNGLIDVFGTDGTLVRRLVTGGSLNSPWGMAVAPNGFGTLGGALLVGNFGDGEINAYDLNSGAFIARFQDANGNPLSIPGLWALAFGNGGNGGQAGTLYFTSGPGDESHGLFGSLAPL